MDKYPGLLIPLANVAIALADSLDAAASAMPYSHEVVVVYVN